MDGIYKEETCNIFLNQVTAPGLLLIWKACSSEEHSIPCVNSNLSFWVKVDKVGEVSLTASKGKSSFTARCFSQHFVHEGGWAAQTKLEMILAWNYEKR